MPDDLVTGAAHDAPLLVRSEEERIVELRIVPWGVVGRTAEGPERIRRGAFRGIRPEDVSLEAIGPHGAEPGVRLAGRAIELEDREDGEYGAFRVSRTRAGDELLELARDRVYRAASAVFQPITSRMVDGVIERQAARLVRVGIVERGAYDGAEVLAVRSAGGGLTMPEREPAPVPDPTPDPVPDPQPTPPGTRVRVVDEPELLGRMEDLRRDLVGRMAALEAGGGRGASSPLARFRTFGEYADAAYSDPELAPLLARALVDQITSDNPGVMGANVVGEIAGILARPRPAITALGGARGLGDSGMDLDWPYLDPALDLDTLVAEQLTEKSEIASVKVKILKGTTPIKTYAGGSDVSYQLIRRSRPAYREAYLRILAIGYARITEATFEAALAAAAGETAPLDPAGDANALRAFLFEASALVEDATGSPATVDLVAPDVFVAVGGMRDLAPPQYGTSNISGVASAATLRIDVSGLPIIRAPFLPAGTHLVTNGEAASWHEDGPFPISAEDVAKLGQNVALWGMGAAAITVPDGIVKNAAPAAARRTSSSSSSS